MIIEKLNHQGHGIGYINNKITFVPKSLPGDEVDVQITKKRPKYNEATIKRIMQSSKERITPDCPFFATCGGCDLLHLTYSKTLEFKVNKVQEILAKYANLDLPLTIEQSPNPHNYRNKITLKIVNQQIGYYTSGTHTIVPINNCLLAVPAINNFIADIPLLKINNGELTIRCNYNQELLIIIDTKDKLNINYQLFKQKHKIVGFIINQKVVQGEGHFIEQINNHLFQVNYDSFFQVNSAVLNIIANYCLTNLKPEETLIDLYCGVGTFSIILANKYQKVYGLEIMPSAITNALINQKINHLANIKYLLGDVKTTITKIKEPVNAILIDPPRSGIDELTMNTIINLKPQTICYISCEPMTLARDLNHLQEFYNINSIKLFDMFPYTNHVESIVFLERK